METAGIATVKQPNINFVFLPTLTFTVMLNNIQHTESMHEFREILSLLVLSCLTPNLNKYNFSI